MIEEGGRASPSASASLVFFIPQVEKETREEMKVYGKPDNLSLAEGAGEDWTDVAREAGLSDERG